jgi:addiction module RelE/StbE family toxin
VLIRSSGEAANDLEDIVDYISQTRPEAAADFNRRVFEAVEDLEVFRARGRKGAVAGTRELILHSLPYVIVYRLEIDAVVVLRIYHGTQDWHGA